MSLKSLPSIRNHLPTEHDGGLARMADAGRPSPASSFRWQRNAVLRATAGTSGDGSLRERVKKLCVDHGLRVSKARCLILGAIWRTEGHPTAEEIFAELRVDDPRINISSVYRNLRTFGKVGIVARLDGRVVRPDMRKPPSAGMSISWMSARARSSSSSRRRSRNCWPGRPRSSATVSWPIG
jgi:Ferric uptake regulator family